MMGRGVKRGMSCDIKAERWPAAISCLAEVQAAASSDGRSSAVADMGSWGNGANAERQSVPHLGDRLIEDHDSSPRVRCYVAGKNFEQSGFPGSIVSHQSMNFRGQEF